jgi:hypothetical protein
MNDPKKLTRHHLRPRSRGGDDLNSNILILKWERHRALHLACGNMTWNEIINNLISALQGKGHRFRWNKERWKLVFGEKSARQAIMLCIRVRQLKRRQKWKS